MIDKYRFLGDVRRNDSTVATMMDRGCSFGDIIVELANQKRQLQQRVIDLDGIAPFKVETPDGTMEWRCPDDLVPSRGLVGS